MKTTTTHDAKSIQELTSLMNETLLDLKNGISLKDLNKKFITTYGEDMGESLYITMLYFIDKLREA